MTIIGVNALVLLGLLLLLEASGQVMALVRPAYDVLFLQPDQILGWKQVPNLRWTWAGHYWYAAEFSVEVETNALGFRDVARELVPAPGTARVALLGDSFIEAVQVPFAGTAAQVLERKLNDAARGRAGDPRKWEVLNFGISNFGIGQYLLAWEQYAMQHRPQYVAIFVARFHMARTVDRYARRAFGPAAGENLWIRPTFGIENGAPVRLPARDFERFGAAQERLLVAEFGGKRARRKEPRLLTLHYGEVLTEALARRLTAHSRPAPRVPASPPRMDFAVFALNLMIIEELGKKVHNAGAKLIVLDASQYFGDDAIVSRTLREFCDSNSFGYVPVYEALLRADRNGSPTRWALDGHFNVAGNAILAQSLYDWIARDAY